MPVAGGDSRDRPAAVDAASAAAVRDHAVYPLADLVGIPGWFGARIRAPQLAATTILQILSGISDRAGGMSRRRRRL